MWLVPGTPRVPPPGELSALRAQVAELEEQLAARDGQLDVAAARLAARDAQLEAAQARLAVPAEQAG